jgi:ABC-type Fe3+/spermidine/putrescine transport system ATPase subunit
VLADRVGVMRNGRILQIGPTDDVFERPGSLFVAEFVGAENVLTGRAEPLADGRARIRLADAEVAAATEIEGPVGVAIRPEDIALAAQPPEGHDNLLAGRLADVSDRGGFLRVTVLVGDTPLCCLLKKDEFHAAGVRIGERATVFFDAGDVHVFQNNEIVRSAESIPEGGR